MRTSVLMLNTELITRQRTASSLTDEELCLSLTSLDLPSTFYEHQKRGLNCLAIQNAQESWSLPSRREAFKYLREYQKRYEVVVPEYNFDEVKPSFGPLEKTRKLYETLNPNFSSLTFNKGFDSGEVEDEIRFCLDWFGKVSYVANDQSKGLDGSISWKQGSLRDGFLICQDRFNQIYLRSLIDENMRLELENMLLEWVNNDRLRHDADTEYDMFMPVLLFNKASIAIEMFYNSFSWDEEQTNKLSIWLERRALELFPTDVLPISNKCPTNHTSSNFYSYEACQNGGILAAQALLRVGIWNKDPELVEMAYVAFHRYMSGIRGDGSNIADATRGCTAADYNIWASQFMSDFLYQWERISDPLWNKAFNDGVTPNKSVEYSLNLLGNFEDINKHTTEKKWDGCGNDKKNRTQQATTRYGEDYYPRISFAPYFENKGRLIEILLDNDRLRDSAYTAQSGANYEFGLLARKPELQLEVSDKIKNRILARINASVPTAILNIGLSKNINGEFIKVDPSSIKIESPSLKDYKPPKKAGWSARYRVKFKTLRDAGLKLDRQTIAFWRSSDELTVRFWMEDLFEENSEARADWKLVFEKCGEFVEDNEFYDLEIPIKTDWEELNEQFECVAENVTSPVTVKLIGLLTYAADNIDFETLKP